MPIYPTKVIVDGCNVFLEPRGGITALEDHATRARLSEETLVRVLSDRGAQYELRNIRRVLISGPLGCVPPGEHGELEGVKMLKERADKDRLTIQTIQESLGDRMSGASCATNGYFAPPLSREELEGLKR